MNAKSLHLLADRNLLWDRCGAELREYADATQWNAVGRRAPAAVQREALAAAACVEGGRALPDALCVRPRNAALECLFQAGGNAYSCARPQAEFDACWRDPAAYAALLSRSTPAQRRDARPNFHTQPGRNNPFV